MDIGEVRLLKIELEKNISVELSRLINQFTNETGVPISSVSTEMINTSVISEEVDSYQVGFTNVSIEI